MSGDANATDELGQIAGPAADGFLFTFAPDPRKYASAKQAVADLQAQGFDPEGYTLYTVAALRGLRAGRPAGRVDQARGPRPGAARRRLSRPSSGEIAFDAKGDVKDPKYSIYRYQNGKYGEICTSRSVGFGSDAIEPTPWIIVCSVPALCRDRAGRRRARDAVALAQRAAGYYPQEAVAFWRRMLALEGGGRPPTFHSPTPRASSCCRRWEWWEADGATAARREHQGVAEER